MCRSKVTRDEREMTTIDQQPGGVPSGSSGSFVAGALSRKSSRFRFAPKGLSTMPSRANTRVPSVVGEWSSRKFANISLETIFVISIGTSPPVWDLPFVKTHREERELTVMLMVDVSSSGAFGSGTKLKNEVAAEIAALLAYTAIKSNDRVGSDYLFGPDRALHSTQEGPFACLAGYPRHPYLSHTDGDVPTFSKRWSTWRRFSQDAWLCL